VLKVPEHSRSRRDRDAPRSELAGGGRRAYRERVADTDRTPRERWRRIIFEHDTRTGRAFDVALIVAILGSVLVVVLDSLPSLPERTHRALWVLEWVFTGLFTVEYAARLWCAPDRKVYAKSFFGVVDLLATLPTWLSVFFPQGRFLALVRVLRVLRVFRILKLTTYVSEASVLVQALRASRHKIAVFVFTVLTTVAVVGSLMFLVEGPASGFTSIPAAMYWAIVTMTTVGYGDIAPETTLGRVLASALMVLGYGIIAVPTGIMTVELQRAARGLSPRAVRCAACGREGHDADAVHCKQCGAKLAERA
jgi:voltage-gated potassium channel